MTDDAKQITDPLQDRAQVRIFTLADYVAEEPSGRLYISGGGLEWIGVPAFSDRLSPFDLVVRLAFPIKIAKDVHVVEIRALTADGIAVGPEPLLQTTMGIDMQNLPDNASEISGTIPVRIAEYPISTRQDEVIFFHLVVDGVLVSRLPVQLRPAEL